VTRRFDAPEYLTEWEGTGRFPAIHDAIFNMTAATLPPGARVLDLGACTGLLTARLNRAGYEVTAAEGNAESYRAGHAAGTWGEAPVWTQYITPATLDGFASLLQERRIDAIIARRVLPEVYDGMAGDFGAFADVLRASPVHTIILEGRKASARTTHPLGSAARETAALWGTWKVTEAAGDVRVLERLP
jgi:hypothetical protein